MFIAFRFFKGPMYIKAVLERIQTVKKLFLLQVELGNETFIEGDLS